jgi:preprotein translocase subunit SecG
MLVLITIVHVVVCLFLIIVVLLQSGKSGDIAAAFGGMGSQTAFGTRTAATVLTKATTWAAIIFMLTSVTLSIYAAKRSNRSGSVLEGTQTAPAKSAPAVPKPTTPTVPSNQQPAPTPNAPTR